MRTESFFVPFYTGKKKNSFSYSGVANLFPRSCSSHLLRSRSSQALNSLMTLSSVRVFMSFHMNLHLHEQKQNRLPHFLERSVVAKQPEFCIQVLTDNESLSFWSCSAKIHDQHEASTHFNPNYLCFTSLSHLWEAGFER